MIRTVFCLRRWRALDYLLFSGASLQAFSMSLCAICRARGCLEQILDKSDTSSKATSGEDGSLAATAASRSSSFCRAS